MSRIPVEDKLSSQRPGQILFIYLWSKKSTNCHPKGTTEMQFFSVNSFLILLFLIKFDNLCHIKDQIF